MWRFPTSQGRRFTAFHKVQVFPNKLITNLIKPLHNSYCWASLTSPLILLLSTMIPSLYHPQKAHRNFLWLEWSQSGSSEILHCFGNWVEWSLGESPHRYHLAALVFLFSSASQGRRMVARFSKRNKNWPGPSLHISSSSTM